MNAYHEENYIPMSTERPIIHWNPRQVQLSFTYQQLHVVKQFHYVSILYAKPMEIDKCRVTTSKYFYLNTEVEIFRIRISYWIPHFCDTILESITVLLV